MQTFYDFVFANCPASARTHRFSSSCGTASVAHAKKAHAEQGFFAARSVLELVKAMGAVLACVFAARMVF